jgi:hypothetical protein
MFVSSSVPKNMRRLTCPAFSTSSHPMLCCWTRRNHFTRKYDQRKTLLICYTVKIDSIGSKCRPSRVNKIEWLSWHVAFVCQKTSHRNMHEDRVSSCLHKKPPSLGFLLFHHLSISIAFYQNDQRCRPWFWTSASSQKSTFMQAMAFWVRLNVEVICRHRNESFNRR